MDKSLLEARPPHTPNDLPRGRKLINDNYCAISVAGNSETANVSGRVTLVNSVRKDLNCVPVTGKDCFVVTGNSGTRTPLNVNYGVTNLVLMQAGHHKRKV